MNCSASPDSLPTVFYVLVLLFSSCYETNLVNTFILIYYHRLILNLICSSQADSYFNRGPLLSFLIKRTSSHVRNFSTEETKEANTFGLENVLRSFLLYSNLSE